MAMVSSRSTLNPNAPLFIPAAVRRVEDFSPEWWGLITTATWFRDYWLSQREEQVENEFDENDLADFLPENIIDDDEEWLVNVDGTQFDEFFLDFQSREGNKLSLPAAGGMLQNGFPKDVEALIKIPSLATARDPKSLVEPAKHWEKPAKYISPKYSPRRIQQPR